MRIGRSVKDFGLAVLLLVVVSSLLLSQGTVAVIDQPHAGDRIVTGQGTPGAVPLTVYDTTSNTKIYLGSSKSVDQKGYFAIAVDPPLTVGQKIVVVDSQGRTSAGVTVVASSDPTGL